MLIDTHAHLYVSQFDADRAAMVARALGVCSHIALPNIDRASQPALDALADAHPGRLLPMAGLHPCHVKPTFEEDLEYFDRLLATGRYVGVGETGLDLYWDKSSLPRQQASLRQHLAWGQRYHLPVVLHSRNAHAETATEVRAALSASGPLRGVFHCFTGTVAEALEVVELGFYLGIGGVLTYKNQDALMAALRAVPRDRVVLETDAPYLPPVPHRGQRNESTYIRLVAERLAEVWAVSVDEVATQTSANARRLFNLPK